MDTTATTPVEDVDTADLSAPAFVKDEQSDENASQASDEEDIAAELGDDEHGFKTKVKRMCVLEDQIKQLTAEKKILSDEKNLLRADVIKFMVDVHCESVNYGSDEVLYLDTKETACSLSRKSLLDSIRSFYEEKGVATDAETDGAQELFDFINSSLGSQTKVVLVREQKNAKKRNRKQAAP